MFNCNQEALQQNTRRWQQCAREMRRQMAQRLTTGDTNRVALAMEYLAQGAWFRSVQALQDFLGSCGGEEACWFVLHGCATDELSDALARTTGHSRIEWLTLANHRATGDICPPLHLPGGQLRHGAT